MTRLFVAAALTLLLGTPALAEPATSLQFGLGHTRITGDELVYDDGDRLSRLIWKSRVPTAQIALSHDLPQGWVLGGKLVSAVGNSGHMVDYDWIAPFNPGTGPDDWTHRSIHPVTDLHRYLDLDVTLGRQVAAFGQTQIAVHGGLKYTEASWRARGGSFVYSEDGFRDTVFEQSDSARSIDYKQRHKAIYAGAEARHQAGAWQFAGLLRAGVSIQPREVDLHWQRDLRFDHKISAQPYVNVGLSGTYAIREDLSLGIEASWQRFFERTGDARVSDIRDGSFYQTDRDGIAGELTTATVAVSLGYSF